MRNVIIILSVLVLFSVPALAERVYITPNDDLSAAALPAFIKVRHHFGDTFSADVPGQAVGLIGLFAKVRAVPEVHLLKPPGGCDPWPECKNGGGEEEEGRTVFPADQTPYGIEQIYNDPGIAATSGGAGVDVAVLDTGVFRDHLDLVNRVEQCVDFTKGGPFNTNIEVGKCEDKHGHGTHVSSTVLADAGSDGKGLYGVAPEADLFAYKVLNNSGSGYEDDIAVAVEYATDNGAEIVSMSLGADSALTILGDAIDYATSNGVLVVAAAGNDGPDEGTIDYPGAHPGAVAVAAIDSAKAVADFSSRGIDDGDDTVISEREVELSAAGVSVLGAALDGGYLEASGTSMATPHVSGLAAKLWQGNGADTRSVLLTTVEDITAGIAAGSGYDIASGYGLPHTS